MVHELFGPRAPWARKVVLDPLPAVLGVETNSLVSLEREEFARCLLYAGRGTRASARPPSARPGEGWASG